MSLKVCCRRPCATNADGIEPGKSLYALSSYTINVMHDNRAAHGIMLEMVRVAPRRLHFGALIEFLTALGRIDEAKEQFPY